MIMFLAAPLGVFLFVLMVLLIAKGMEKHKGHTVAVLTFGVLAGGFAVVLLYLMLARSDAELLARSEVELAEVELQQARRHQVGAANQLVPVALSAESAAGVIPVEVDLEAEQASSAPKPAWVDEPKRLVGNDYFVTVTVGPHADRELCDRAMTEELRRATEQYIDQLIGAEGAGQLVRLPMSDVRRQIVQEEYQETVQASFGPMINLHALLKFDKEMQQRIVLAHEQALVRGRIGMAAGGSGLLMVILGTMFGYLKLDTATRGYYSGRLKIAAAAVILTAVAGTAVMARQSNTALVLAGYHSSVGATNVFQDR